MFDEWWFERRLHKLHRDRRRYDERIRRRIATARKEKRQDDVERLESDVEFEWRFAQEEIENFVTNYVTERARLLLIPVPSSTDWEDTSIIGYRVLKDDAIKRLRDEIHDETTKKWQRRFIWMTPLTSFFGMLTGLGGVVIGLLALWLKK